MVDLAVIMVVMVVVDILEVEQEGRIVTILLDHMVVEVVLVSFIQLFLPMEKQLEALVLLIMPMIQDLLVREDLG